MATAFLRTSDCLRHGGDARFLKVYGAASPSPRRKKLHPHQQSKNSEAAELEKDRPKEDRGKKKNFSQQQQQRRRQVNRRQQQQRNHRNGRNGESKMVVSDESVAKVPAKRALQMGKVTILKRGDEEIVQRLREQSFFGNDSETLKLGASALIVKTEVGKEEWAGPGFVNSPSPRCLPIPKLWRLPPPPSSTSSSSSDYGEDDGDGEHDAATKNLRRFLGLLEYSWQVPPTFLQVTLATAMEVARFVCSAQPNG